MSLTRASLGHYLRIHLPATVGVAIAVTVLAGALLVDASVRASLQALSRQRAGLTDMTISTATSFGGRLGAAMAIAAPDAIAGTTSLIAVTGTVSHAESGRTAVGVLIYGVDQTFWTFHGVPPVALAALEAAVSERLARELGAGQGDGLIIRARGASDIPLATLPGRRADAGARLRVTTVRALEPDRMGEFALHPQQSPVAAVFVPLPLLQRELGWPGRVNTILVRHPAGGGEAGRGPPLDAVRHAWLAGAALPDFGVRIRRVPGDRVMALEGLGGVIDPAIVARVLAALQRLQRPGVPALAYVTTAIRAGDRAIPYSTVTAIDLDAYNRLSVPAGPPAPGTDAMSNGDPLVRGSLEIRVGRGGARVGRVQVTEAGPRPRADAPAGERPRTPANPAVVVASAGPLWLNEWAAADLGARPGDPVRLEYSVWTDRGGLQSRQATFTMQGIVPMMRIGGDRTLIPDYPGITTARDLSAWRPSFPVDLARVRPLDEDYWDRWRTAPKAIVPLEVGQRLWASRFGEVSSIRFALRDAEAVAAAVRAEVSSQVVVRAAGHEVITGAAGTTDLGRHFLGFSVLLLIAALSIVYLCTALAVEQRAAEVGLLATVGFPELRIRRAFFTEGVAVLLVGVTVGTAGAAGYAAILLLGLRTWWVDAVETTRLRLHLDPLAWALGVAAAVPLALLAIWIGTGTLARRSPRGLMAGRSAVVMAEPRSCDRSLVPALALAIAAGGLLLAVGTGTLGPTPGFFGAGAALLATGLLAFSAWVRRRASGSSPPQVTGVWGLGITHAAWRPARTVVTVSLIAITTFVLLSVPALRPDGGPPLARASGAGGFALLAESAAPLMHDPNTAAGQAGLGLDASEMRDVRVVRLRLRTGDEASRRSLYRPRNPRIAGVTPEDLEGRFTFADAGATPPGTSTWRLLDQPAADDLVPAIVDQRTLTDVLQLGVGDVFRFAPDGITPVGFRIVASLSDSVFQSEIVIGEAAFGRLFPRDEGYRIWLIDVPEAGAADLGTTLANRLASSSLSVVDTRTRQASYRRVEPVYRAAFQALGALGLLLGMVAVGAVLARNVLERQRQWRWLRVVGYCPGHLRRLVIAEGAVMLVSGVVLGTVSAAVAAAPALVDGARPLPLRDIVLVLLTVGAAGLAAALGALRTVTGELTVRSLKAD